MALARIIIACLVASTVAYSGVSSMLPTCECEVFRDGLTTANVGEEACAFKSVYGPDDHEFTICKPPQERQFPGLTDGCPASHYRCKVAYKQVPTTFPLCACDTFENGLPTADQLGNAGTVCQRKVAVGGKTKCYPPNPNQVDEAIGYGNLWGCPANTFACQPAVKLLLTQDDSPCFGDESSFEFEGQLVQPNLNVIEFTPFGTLASGQVYYAATQIYVLSKSSGSVLTCFGPSQVYPETNFSLYYDADCSGNGEASPEWLSRPGGPLQQRSAELPPAVGTGCSTIGFTFPTSSPSPWPPLGTRMWGNSGCNAVYPNPDGVLTTTVSVATRANTPTCPKRLNPFRRVSGNCAFNLATDGGFYCLFSKEGNGEPCEFIVDRATAVAVSPNPTLDASKYDCENTFLEVGAQTFCQANLLESPKDVIVPAGGKIKWATQGVTNSGSWRICEAFASGGVPGVGPVTVHWVVPT